MNQSEGKNPEHRSNNALLCFCLGAGLAGLAYVLGVGAAFASLFTGADPGLVAGGIFAAVGLVLLTITGLVMMLIGGVWMVLRVIADQSGDANEKRYRDVER